MNILYRYTPSRGALNPKIEIFLVPLAVVVFVQCIEVRCKVGNADVDGAALTCDAPTTSD